MMRRGASSSSGGGGESVVVDVGRRRSTCGYCKSGRRSSVTHGLLANSLTVYDYQDLLDRGWRRSGCYLYKPEMETTCCPAYTIRLKADKFSPSKEQRRVSKRMQRYLDGIWDSKNQELADKSGQSQVHAHDDVLSNTSQTESLGRREQNTKEEELLDYLSKQIDFAIQSFVKSKDFPCDIQYPKGIVKKVSQTKKRWLVDGSEDLLYTSSISFQLVATLRRAKSDENDVQLLGTKKDDLAVKGSSYDLLPKDISEELANALQHLVEVPDLSIKACNGHLNFYSSVKAVCSDEESQVAISRESSMQESKGHCMISENLERKKRKLEILLNRSSFDPEEFALYRKYQTKVHNDEPDDITTLSYRRFLVESPLIYVPPTGDDTVPSCGFGAFHQQYRIDGRSLQLGWVPYDVAKPLLDRSRYAVLSDYTNMQNRDSMATQEPGKRLEQQHNDPGDEDFNDAYVGGDDSMLESDSSEDELSPETNDLANVDFSCFIFDLGGTRLRYQEFQHALRPDGQLQLKKQLLKYMKVVGRISQKEWFTPLVSFVNL